MSADRSPAQRRYQRALDEGRMAFGVFSVLDGYAVSHLFASAGYDFVIIDVQHSAFTWPELENMCFRIQSEGASVFIRTASTEPAEVNLALDLPVDGLILPNIASLAEARAAFEQTKFPPAGVRSLGNERHDVIWQAYDLPDPLVGMLVEHPGAVADIEAIFAELPVDFAWIGTHDLSAMMGFDPHDVVARGYMPDELVAAMDRVRQAAHTHGVRFWSNEPGADATIAGVDARIVKQAAIDALERARAALAPAEQLA